MFFHLPTNPATKNHQFCSFSTFQFSIFHFLFYISQFSIIWLPLSWQLKSNNRTRRRRKRGVGNWSSSWILPSMDKRRWLEWGNLQAKTIKSYPDYFFLLFLLYFLFFVLIKCVLIDVCVFLLFFAWNNWVSAASFKRRRRKMR